MIIRIFIPEQIYRLKFIANLKCYLVFGNIVSDNGGKNVSIFVVNVCESSEQTKFSSQVIGGISNNLNELKKLPSDFITFGVDQNKSVLKLNRVQLPSFVPTDATLQTQIFLYDLKTFSELSRRTDEHEWCLRPDPISQLLLLIKHKEKCKVKPHETTKDDESYQNQLLSFLLLLSMFAQTKLVFLSSSFLKHFQFWTHNLEKLSKNRAHIWTILLDVFAGIIVMLWLWRIAIADEYLIRLALIIVKELQNLLDALKGSPVGLKINMDLNNFFIDCFRYHVDLWATFLVIISPLVKYLFVPLSIIGCFGLSFQLSMLSDLLSIITLHSHCIYTYASIIYQIEVKGLVGVWRVVSGRRKNILKDRIESYEYTNQQLYLSTICFSALLFLLPTILVYYVVFASLRFALFCFTYLLTLAQQRLLSIPVFYIIEWCLGRHASSDNFEVIPLENKQNPTLDVLEVSLFSIKTVRSRPSWIPSN